jgi:hypothetical protein
MLDVVIADQSFELTLTLCDKVPVQASYTATVASETAASMLVDTVKAQLEGAGWPMASRRTKREAESRPVTQR